MSVPLPDPGDTNWNDWGTQVHNITQAVNDSDLLALGGLDSTTSGAIASDGAGWVKKTYAQFKSALGLTKSDVGLGSVTNTSDAAKPVSTAQQTALDGKAAVSHTHSLSGLTATGTKDTTTFLRGDNTWAVPPGSGGGGGSGVQIGGDLGGTTSSPTVIRRAPVGGVQTPIYTSTVTPDASQGVHQRYVATGNLTINVPTGGVDGQPLVFEVQASASPWTVTFAAGYETSQAVPGRVFTIPSGTWGYFTVRLRSSTWRLTYAEPQTVLPEVPSAWTPADNGLLAWTADPSAVNSTAAPSATDGYFVGAVLKLDQATTVSNIVCQVTTAGSGFTASRNYLGLYSVQTSGLLASTADLSSTWNSTGVKTIPVTTPAAVAAGFYLVALITTATTKPVFAASAVQTGILNYGRTNSAVRSWFTATAYTALPATAPLASGAGNLMFFGLS